MTQQPPSSQTGSHRRPLPLHLVNLVAYGLNTLITYGVGAAGWLDLPSNAVLSAKYQSLVTPAGWAFAIWGVIFVSQLVWTLWQQPILRRLDDDPTHILPTSVKAVGLDYLYVCLAQMGWTVSFTTEHIGLSLIFMVMILAFLLLIVNNLRRVGDQSGDSYFIYHFPFSIHAAWIMAATIVNLNVVLVWTEASAKAQFVVGAVSLLTLLGGLILRLLKYEDKPDWTFPFVLMWALLGVYSELSAPKDSIVERFSSQEISMVRSGALGGVGVLGLTSLIKAYLSRQPVESSSSSNTEEATYLRATDVNGTEAK